MAGTPGVVTPYPLAMVICDGLWRDPYTGKTTLIGTFSAIGGHSFPLVHPILSVYVALTDGQGRIPVKLELVDVDEVREPIFAQETEVESSDPRSVMELHFQATGLEFPAPGEYRLKLFANSEFIIERRVIVVGRMPEESES